MSRKLSKKRKLTKAEKKRHRQIDRNIRRAIRPYRSSNLQSKIANRKITMAQKAKRSASSPKPLSPSTSKAKRLEFHSYSMLLPMMSASEREALKADIAANGLRDAIILLDGQILDGRNRYEICLELGIKPEFVEFKKSWGDPLAFVYSRALHRNLKDGQKACAAVYFDEKFSEQARERSLANLKNAQPWKIGETMTLSLQGSPDEYAIAGYKGDVVLLVAAYDKSGIIPPYEVPIEELRKIASHGQQTTDNGQGRSRDRAAALFGISGRLVQYAKLVKAHNPKLFDDAFNGRIEVTKAARSIHRDKKAKKLAAAITGPAISLDNCRVDVGDNLKLLPTYKRRGFRLVIDDPQYNIGINYGKGEKADRLSEKEYLSRAQQRYEQCSELLTPDGAIWIVINHENAADFEQILKGLGLHPRAWITWYETFGNNCTDNFNRTSRRLLYFTKHEKTFFFDRRPFMRKSARQIIYNDKRQNHDGKLWDDVWIIPRLVDNAKERIPGVPTQLPLALIQPIVEGCSEVGDSVLDPHNGSGTSGEACLITGRIFQGCEINKDYAELARQRWQRTFEANSTPQNSSTEAA
jgi:DNA modification methylase